ncbi:nitroreductase family protein [Hirschia litorea]|uniref:Putative NAD(P)H nitroreductase n=1 Tax=Hirschia litorea TaxID=1199156 RepID=A0ABW2IKL9_9PROT
MSKTPQFPPLPALNDVLAATNPSSEALSFLANRRSTPIKCLTAPGPDEATLESILQIASRVPDHRKLEPWRFIVIQGDARKSTGETLAKIKHKKCPNLSVSELDEEKSRFTRTPVCIAVVSSPDPSHKTPVWEQELSAGALCMNLLLTANAAGWAGAWLTEWYAFDADFHAEMGLSDTEKFAGFIYLGTAMQNPPERPRPNISTKIKYQK